MAVSGDSLVGHGAWELESLEEGAGLQKPRVREQYSGAGSPHRNCSRERGAVGSLEGEPQRGQPAGPHPEPQPLLLIPGYLRAGARHEEELSGGQCAGRGRAAMSLAEAQAAPANLLRRAQGLSPTLAGAVGLPCHP